MIGLNLAVVETPVPKSNEKTEQTKIVLETPYTGKKFVFTGKLETFNRKRGKEMIEMMGGIVKDTFSFNTDYLVVGNLSEETSKVKKAKEKKEIKILDEKAFLEIISSYTPKETSSHHSES
eukprot:TRINITY_DN4171_c0_g1_i2.p1 TRINITY_DN4171_c0_g1~~TRINITY_DN4171_c0_g1_i2.p1  ORF type:complete len:121 (-),score=29.60 TRINITY_DN4171_c0_g1_i2:92-454(-)